MTSCSASGDVLKYLLLNLTWSLEASNSAPELSKRCVFGSEMLYAWHVPKAGFLATVWHPLLPIYFKVETKQKCSACQKKKKKKKSTQLFFLLYRNGWKNRNTGLLTSIEKMMSFGSFLSITQQSQDTLEIRWVSFQPLTTDGLNWAEFFDDREEKPMALE